MKSFFRDIVRSCYFMYTCVSKWLCTKLSFEMKLAPPKTVPYVDLNRYSGKWFEIASLPTSYNEGCIGTTSTFGKPKSNKIDIILRYYEDNFNGAVKERELTGKVIDKKTNAKLEVQIFWPFSYDFWILDLGDNYEYSAIGEPDRSSLWILSRTSTMSDEVYNEIVNRMKAQGYNTSRLKKTPQK